MRAKIANALALPFSAMLLAACTATADGGASPPKEDAPTSTSLRLLQTYAQCPQRADTEHLSVFSNAAEWSRHSSALGASAARPLPPVPGNINWQREAVVLVGIGPRRNAGYGLELGSPASVVAGELQLQLTLKEPSAGGFQAMVLTQPCSYYLVGTQSFDRVILSSKQDSKKTPLTKRKAPN